MIIVKLESASIWIGKPGTLFLTVFNSGPEDLYCSSEEYEPPGGEPYIRISSLRLEPSVGATEEALAYEYGDIKFQVARQENLSEEDIQNRFYQWVCVSGDSYVSVRPLDGVARLLKGQSLRIQADINGEKLKDGMGLLSYSFRDWERYSADKKKLTDKTSDRQQLWVTKDTMPSIEFKPKNESYPYGEYTEVSWKISNINRNTKEYSITINGQDAGNGPEGNCTLLMKDISHILEFRCNVTGLTLQKKLWPIWFRMEKMPHPESKIPDEEGKVAFWWNVTEASKCKFQGLERDARDHTEIWSVADGTAEFSLSYYDEDKFEKKVPESGALLYTKPCIEEFKLVSHSKLSNVAKRYLSGFITLEETEEMEALVNGVYGGDFPEPPPPPARVSLHIKGSCVGEKCFLSVNKEGIQTLAVKDIRKGTTVTARKSGHYLLAFWDEYGCKVKKEI